MAGCGYLTSRRDSVVRHIKRVHHGEGKINQYDSDSWQQLRDSDPELPQNCPSLPLHVKSLGERCRRPRQPVRDNTTEPRQTTPVGQNIATIQNHVAVRRVDNISVPTQTATNQPSTSSRVERSPIVIVEKRFGLHRLITRRERQAETLEALAREAREDVTRYRGQLTKAELKQK